MACGLKLSPVNLSSANLLTPWAFQTRPGLKDASGLRLKGPLRAGAGKIL
jgi:hypothetical protein